MKSKRQAIGQWGETLAANFLTERGYLILDKNVRTPHGEIDLIAEELNEVPEVGRSDKTIIFVEVKTRTTHAFGYPEDSITLRKIEHLVAAAEYYLQNYPEVNLDWRIDVISIERIKSEKDPQIVHFKNAIHN